MFLYKTMIVNALRLGDFARIFFYQSYIKLILIVVFQKKKFFITE